MTSGLTKLVQGAARIFRGGPVAQAVVVMEQGTLIIMSVGDNSVLAVLAAPECDMGTVAYEMTLLGERAGPTLARNTPRMVAFLSVVALTHPPDGRAGICDI